MAEQTPYEQLGVTEDASFDEIQLARQRLMAACGGDRQEVAAIESAYDAVLMHRLRLRQAGKIKVPDRIRFAEETSESALSPEPSVRPVSSPEWLKSYLDQPSPNDILGSGLILGSLAGIILFIPALSSSVLSVLIVAA
ncbi:MAG: CPP1-like family protein, partial [Prochlorotrichaceae cyanobacterium]